MRQEGREDSGESLLDVLLATVYCGCEPAAVRMVLRYCRAAGLDPLRKPVHVVPMRDRSTGELRPTVVPGIGLYRTIAARCGCAGVDEPEFGPEASDSAGAVQWTFPQWCRVTVRRRLATGEIVTFTAREFWRENAVFAAQPDGLAQPNEIWSRRPYGQLAKCTEAQALRKAFPEIGAQPVAEELEGKALGAPAASVRAETARAQPARADVGQAPAVTMPVARRPDMPRALADSGAGETAASQNASDAVVAAAHERPAGQPQDLLAERAVPPHPNPDPDPDSDTDTDPDPNTEPEDGQVTPMPRGSARPGATDTQVVAHAPDYSGLATAGERAYIQRRIASRGMSVAVALSAAGLEDAPGHVGAYLEGLTRSGFAALLKVTA